MKRITALILAFALFAAAGCAKQDSGTEKKPASAPSMGLHAAAAAGNLEMIRQHIEAGSDLNVRDPKGGACPLSTAALFGHTEAANALIEAGADINCRGNDGATPLHVAAFFCRAEIVKALLDKGADKTIKNSYGSTPLETVTSPFEEVKPVYDHFAKTFGPAGMKLDYDTIREMRVEIAKMLQ
jgi:hypothetical protein